MDFILSSFSAVGIESIIQLTCDERQTNEQTIERKKNKFETEIFGWKKS